MEKDLLEVLRKKVGCAYISDLRTKEYNEKGIKAFEKINLKDYEQSMVDDARRYLFEI